MTMNWPRRLDIRLTEPVEIDDTSDLELETAKEILSEALLAWPSEVEEMIQVRIEKKSLMDETDLWRSTFCINE